MLSPSELRFGSHEASDVVSMRSMAVSITSTQVSMKEGGTGIGETMVGMSGEGGGGKELENPHSMGIDAVKKLRQNYNINKVRQQRISSRLQHVCRKVQYTDNWVFV